jgi:hypothetical protein
VCDCLPRSGDVCLGLEQTTKPNALPVIGPFSEIFELCESGR